MTFSLEIVTAEQKAAERVLAVKNAAKAECSRRIFEVADLVTQQNLLANYGAGKLTSEQMATYEAGLDWIKAMRGNHKRLADESGDIYDDANWPPVPEGVLDLAAEF